MCTSSCKHFQMNWPSNLPKSDCRLAADLLVEVNPVTRASIKAILQNRKNERRVIQCPIKEVK